MKFKNHFLMSILLILLYVNGLKAENISKTLQTSLLRNVNIYAEEK